MKSRRLRLWLVVIVFCLSLGVLLVSAWPVPREQASIALPVLSGGVPLTPTGSEEMLQAVLPEQRKIVVDWPVRIRDADADWVVLSLVADPPGEVTAALEAPNQSGDLQPFEAANLYETHNVVAVARLDMAGLGAWREPLREPLRPGRPVTFRWSVRAEDADVYRGVLWLSLEFVPLAGGPVESMTLLSRLLTIDAVSILGLPGWAGRAAGGAGLVLSTLFGLPLLQPWLAGGMGR